MEISLQLNFEVVMKGENFFISVTQFEAIRFAHGFYIKDKSFVFDVPGSKAVRSAKIPDMLMPLMLMSRDIVFAKVNKSGVCDAVTISSMNPCVF
jgi:hypothetical protein